MTGQPSHRDMIRDMIESPLVREAMNAAVEGSRARLNTAIQTLDDELGDADPAVVAAFERFVIAMWKEF